MQSSTGEPFDLADYEGRTLLLSFFFAHCRSACPLQARRLAALQRQLSKQTKAHTAFLSVSIDPQRDTNEALQAFAEQHAIDAAHWTLARTRDRATLDALLEQVTLIVVRDSKSAEIDHRMTLLLIDPLGRPVQRYIGDAFDVDRLSRELDTLVRIHHGSPADANAR